MGRPRRAAPATSLPRRSAPERQLRGRSRRLHLRQVGLLPYEARRCAEPIADIQTRCGTAHSSSPQHGEIGPARTLVHSAAKGSSETKVTGCCAWNERPLSGKTAISGQTSIFSRQYAHDDIVVPCFADARAFALTPFLDKTAGTIASDCPLIVFEHPEIDPI